MSHIYSTVILCNLRALVQVNLRTTFQGLPLISRFSTNKEDNGSSCCESEQPLYEDESETETVASHPRKPVSSSL